MYPDFTRVFIYWSFIYLSTSIFLAYVNPLDIITLTPNLLYI
jgi:hypothetical protein